MGGEYGFGVDYWSTVGNSPHGGKTGEPGFLWLRRFDAHLPFTATLVVHFPDGGRLCIINAASPVSARKTRVFVPIARNFDTDQPVQDVYDFNLRIFEEDRAIVEVQKPENLPLDPRLEVNIPADRSSIAYRRGLRDLGLSHFFTAWAGPVNVNGARHSPRRAGAKSVGTPPCASPRPHRDHQRRAVRHSHRRVPSRVQAALAQAEEAIASGDKERISRVEADMEKVYAEISPTVAATHLYMMRKFVGHGLKVPSEA